MVGTVGGLDEHPERLFLVIGVALGLGLGVPIGALLVSFLQSS